jgi:hypothetical protein
VEPGWAFILCLCWEQANLRGGRVTLERLEDREAVVRLAPPYFALHESTAHSRRQIPLGDSRALFEDRWQDRAKRAGWKLEMSGGSRECLLRFTRGDR